MGEPISNPPQKRHRKGTISKTWEINRRNLLYRCCSLWWRRSHPTSQRVWGKWTIFTPTTPIKSCVHASIHPTQLEGREQRSPVDSMPFHSMPFICLRAHSRRWKSDFRWANGRSSAQIPFPVKNVISHYE